MTYPDGEVLAYEYDEGGLLTKATGTRASEVEVYLADVGYDEFGQRVRAEYGNGVVTKYTHEPQTRRLSTLTSKLSPVTGGTTFQALTYHYDAVGNVESLTNALPSPVSTPFGGAVSYTYEYDDVNRLKLATGKAASRPGVDDTFAASWEYSDIHNLTRATLQRQVTSMSGVEHPPAETRDEAYGYEGVHPHRARTIGTLGLEYDEDGNTTRECEGPTCAPGRASTFVWDEEGRMEEATAKGRLVRFRYDADGQRMVKLAAGGPVFTFGQWWTMAGNSHATKHVFAGAGRVATKMLPAATTQANTPPGGTPGTGWPNTNGCIPSGNQPQKCPTNSNGGMWVERGVARPATWYYHSDSLGSTQWLTDDEGKLHERVEYYPYGEVWRQSSGQGVHKLRQAFLYTGKEYDSETGLTYFGARYYDSRHARWMSPDPVLIDHREFWTSPVSPQPTNDATTPANLSPYTLSNGNPLSKIDPDGAEVVWLDSNLRDRILQLAKTYPLLGPQLDRLDRSPGRFLFNAGVPKQFGRADSGLWELVNTAESTLSPKGGSLLTTINAGKIDKAGPATRTQEDVVIDAMVHIIAALDRVEAGKKVQDWDSSREEPRAYAEQMFYRDFSGLRNTKAFLDGVSNVKDLPGNAGLWKQKYPFPDPTTPIPELGSAARLRSMVLLLDKGSAE